VCSSDLGARLKLEPHSLNRFFSFGAFGDDHEDRNELLPIAVRRLREEFGVAVEYEDCIVIGDTPRDIACAHENGSMALAVATGPYSEDELRDAGAQMVVSDLSDTSVVCEWLLGNRGMGR
jgi:phosphoglycolate phosphatase